MNEYDIGKAFAAIEEELITSMMGNMKRHRDWEDAEGFNWSMWQAEQLKSLNQYKRQNNKKFEKQFNGINRSIKEVIEQARKQGNMEQEIQILKALKKGWKPKRRSGQIDAAKFFRMNDRKLNALIKATEKDFERAEVAMLRRANDQYRKVIFNAQVYANTGAGTYEKAVDMATRDFLSAGINCIEYKDGARHTMSDYSDMAIRTAAKRAYLTGEGEKRNQWGISTVIVNKRGNPCPKCLPFVGKIMIDDVWSGGKATHGPYPLMSSAIAAGLYHPRCKDSHSTYFPAITERQGKFKKAEIKKVEQDYKGEQEATREKNQISRYKRLKKYSFSSDNINLNKVRLQSWNHKLLETEKVNSLIDAIGDIDEDTLNRRTLAKKFLSGMDLEHIDIHINKMTPFGYCSLNTDTNNIVKITSYNLNSQDRRMKKYQIKTVFHEGYHAKMDSMKSDHIKIGMDKWLMIEETFAESSAHYLSKRFGIVDLSPSYAEKLIDILPRLKQLPEFQRCKTIADFGEIALKKRLTGIAPEWEALYNKCEAIPHVWTEYAKGYIPYMKAHAEELVGKMIENMPGYEVHKASMLTDAQNGVLKINNGETLSHHEEFVMRNILAISMNREGVK